MRALILIIVLLLPLELWSQSVSEQIAGLEVERITKEKELDDLKNELSNLKLQLIMEQLNEMGWPSNDEVIQHAAMALSYDENHEQARWVSHIILTDIIEGRTSRTNDFRPDPLVTTGSAVEADYFLKEEREDGTTIAYDGFGYDRGHLAPSADFRWNQQALSESYYYSNMSPQRPEFNREGWAELEGLMRGYIYRNEVNLYVVTGPILQDDLPKVERSTNQVSIPEYYFKVVADLDNQRGIAFLMPNSSIDFPLETYAVPIDRIEEETGFNFFPSLEEDLAGKIESATDYSPWLSEEESEDVEPLYQPDLAKNQFNTVVAKAYAGTGQRIQVCGTVVSASKSGKGNVFINLDKKFPNQIFSVNIWQSALVNFSYDPVETLINQEICVKGKVSLHQGVPSMSCESEKRITIR